MDSLKDKETKIGSDGQLEVDESNDENNNSTSVGEDKWNEGDECVAKWEDDGCWYKAIVEAVEGDTAVVTFTQYGNSAYCSVELLKDKNTKISSDGQLEIEECYDGEWE